MLGRASGTAHDLLRVTVRCDSDAPARARAALLHLADLGHGVGDALLVLSELVSNAVRHSGSGREDLLDICVRQVDRGLTVSVHDPGVSGRAAAVSGSENVSFGGMGLRIVEQLSAEWGTARDDDGYLVWARVPLEHPPEEPH
jgi:anti-sigma regulatory factor (Ser/Thr protein kinase)